MITTSARNGISENAAGTSTSLSFRFSFGAEVGQVDASSQSGLTSEVDQRGSHRLQFAEILSRACRCNLLQLASSRVARGLADLGHEPRLCALPRAARSSSSSVRVSSYLVSMQFSYERLIVRDKRPLRELTSMPMTLIANSSERCGRRGALLGR